MLLRLKSPVFQNSEEFCDVNQFDDLDLDTAQNEPVQNKKHKVAAALFKLNFFFFYVPSDAVYQFFKKLQYLLSMAFLCSTTKVIHDTLNSYNLHVDESVIKESVLVFAYPVYKSVAKDCPLATSFKRYSCGTHRIYIGSKR